MFNYTLNGLNYELDYEDLLCFSHTNKFAVDKSDLYITSNNNYIYTTNVYMNDNNVSHRETAVFAINHLNISLNPTLTFNCNLLKKNNKIKSFSIPSFISIKLYSNNNLHVLLSINKKSISCQSFAFNSFEDSLDAFNQKVARKQLLFNQLFA